LYARLVEEVFEQYAFPQDVDAPALDAVERDDLGVRRMREYLVVRVLFRRIDEPVRPGREYFTDIDMLASGHGVFLQIEEWTTGPCPGIL
jgi:hypothetical protein